LIRTGKPIVGLLFLVLFCLFFNACEISSEVETDPAVTSDLPTDDDDDASDEPDLALSYSIDLAQTWMRYFAPEQNAWSWDSGVMMMGFLSLWEVTGDDDYFDYVQAWIDSYIAAGYHITSSDTSIPGYSALQLYKHTNNPAYLEVGARVWDYIAEKAGRTSEGGLNHMGWISGNQIWVDTLFMVGPFMLEYASITSDNAPYEEFALQLDVFRNRLRDDETGLYRHRYDDDTGELMPADKLYWGRGNGWVFNALNYAKQNLPEQYQDGLSFDLDADTAQMKESFLNAPTFGGRFHTILNREETYLETSAALLFAHGLTLAMDADGQMNTEDMERVEHYLSGAIDQIVTDSAQNTLLLGTSYGTSPGSVEYYHEVLKGENVAYGVGLFLLTACAREKLGRIEPVLPIHGATDETFAVPPPDDASVAMGKYHIMRGNFPAAKIALSDALAQNPDDTEAVFYDALIDGIRLVFGLIKKIDRRYVGDIGLFAFVDSVAKDVVEKGAPLADKMDTVLWDEEFSTTLDRLLIIEGGGHSCIGSRQYDRGEVYLISGLAHLLVGVGQMLGEDPALFSMRPPNFADLIDRLYSYPWPAGNKSVATGIDEIMIAIDQITLGIDSIMAETDDQSDDLIPKNLLELSGTFVLPGVLPEQDVMEMLTGFGIPGGFLNRLDMPGALVSALNAVYQTLWFIKAAFYGG
jgi:unsaturated rhamnogalacturonyl hydrolase